MANEEKFQALSGKVLCNDDGSAVLFTAVDFVDRNIAGGGTKTVLQLSGLARAMLVNPQNPSQGTEPLPTDLSPMAVTVDIDVEKDDLAAALGQLSRALDLSEEDKIVDDGGDWIGRFSPDDKKSLVPVLRQKGAFVKISLKNDIEKSLKFGELPFFYNLFSPPKRKAADAVTVGNLKAKLKAKNAAKLGGVLDGAVTDTSWA